MTKMMTTTAALLMTLVAMAEEQVAPKMEVDFAQTKGPMKKAIHSSGWGAVSNPRAIQNDDEVVKSMNLEYARIHDWALVNGGQRVVDYQYVFPLIDKDAKDPSNYYFEATDHLLDLTRKLGIKIFYRLGTSIEHTGDVHFNATVPKDFDKVAEIFAATVRHYNRGWANGHKWDIKYWEIWNEPDGIANMWCLPEKEGGKDEKLMRQKFVKFFVTCLKRLKDEFGDSIKVGGPALCYWNPVYFGELLDACKQAGVSPDFLSWHGYNQWADSLIIDAEKARKFCDERGFKKTELILNEYHYLVTWDGIHGQNSTPEMVKKAVNGPTGINGIDSACFYLEILSCAQGAPLDQAYYYGCGMQGNWGYRDMYKQFNKPYYAAVLYGKLLKEFPMFSGVVHAGSKVGTLNALAAKSADGKRKALLVTDYRSRVKRLAIDVKGVPADARVSATLLDDTHNNAPCAVVFKDGKIVVDKPDELSFSMLVVFEEI